MRQYRRALPARSEARNAFCLARLELTPAAVHGGASSFIRQDTPHALATPSLHCSSHKVPVPATVRHLGPAHHVPCVEQRRGGRRGVHQATAAPTAPTRRRHRPCPWRWQRAHCACRCPCTCSAVGARRRALGAAAAAAAAAGPARARLASPTPTPTALGGCLGLGRCLIVCSLAPGDHASQAHLGDPPVWTPPLTPPSSTRGALPEVVNIRPRPTVQLPLPRLRRLTQQAQVLDRDEVRQVW